MKEGNSSSDKRRRRKTRGRYEHDDNDDDDYLPERELPTETRKRRQGLQGWSASIGHEHSMIENQLKQALSSNNCSKVLFRPWMELSNAQFKQTEPLRANADLSYLAELEREKSEWTSHQKGALRDNEGNDKQNGKTEKQNTKKHEGLSPGSNEYVSTVTAVGPQNSSPRSHEYPLVISKGNFNNVGMVISENSSQESYRVGSSRGTASHNCTTESEVLNDAVSFLTERVNKEVQTCQTTEAIEDVYMPLEHEQSAKNQDTIHSHSENDGLTIRPISPKSHEDQPENCNGVSGIVFIYIGVESEQTKSDTGNETEFMGITSELLLDVASFLRERSRNKIQSLQSPEETSYTSIACGHEKSTMKPSHQQDTPDNDCITDAPTVRTNQSSTSSLKNQFEISNKMFNNVLEDTNKESSQQDHREQTDYGSVDSIDSTKTESKRLMDAFQFLSDRSSKDIQLLQPPRDNNNVYVILSNEQSVTKNPQDQDGQHSDDVNKSIGAEQNTRCFTEEDGESCTFSNEFVTVSGDKSSKECRILPNNSKEVSAMLFRQEQQTTNDNLDGHIDNVIVPIGSNPSSSGSYQVTQVHDKKLKNVPELLGEEASVVREQVENATDVISTNNCVTFGIKEINVEDLRKNVVGGCFLLDAKKLEGRLFNEHDEAECNVTNDVLSFSQDKSSSEIHQPQNPVGNGILLCSQEQLIGQDLAERNHDIDNGIVTIANKESKTKIPTTEEIKAALSSMLQFREKPEHKNEYHDQTPKICESTNKSYQLHPATVPLSQKQPSSQSSYLPPSTEALAYSSPCSTTQSRTLHNDAGVLVRDETSKLHAAHKSNTSTVPSYSSSSFQNNERLSTPCSREPSQLSYISPIPSQPINSHCIAAASEHSPYQSTSLHNSTTETNLSPSNQNGKPPPLIGLHLNAETLFNQEELSTLLKNLPPHLRAPTIPASIQTDLSSSLHSNTEEITYHFFSPRADLPFMLDKVTLNILDQNEEAHKPNNRGQSSSQSSDRNQNSNTESPLLEQLPPNFRKMRNYLHAPKISAFQRQTMPSPSRSLHIKDQTPSHSRSLPPYLSATIISPSSREIPSTPSSLHTNAGGHAPLIRQNSHFHNSGLHPPLGAPTFLHSSRETQTYPPNLSKNIAEQHQFHSNTTNLPITVLSSREDPSSQLSSLHAETEAHKSSTLKLSSNHKQLPSQPSGLCAVVPPYSPSSQEKPSSPPSRLHSNKAAHASHRWEQSLFQSSSLSPHKKTPILSRSSQTALSSQTYGSQSKLVVQTSNSQENTQCSIFQNDLKSPTVSFLTREGQSSQPCSSQPETEAHRPYSPVKSYTREKLRAFCARVRSPSKQEKPSFSPTKVHSNKAAHASQSWEQPLSIQSCVSKPTNPLSNREKVTSLSNTTNSPSKVNTFRKQSSSPSSIEHLHLGKSIILPSSDKEPAASPGTLHCNSGTRTPEAEKFTSSCLENSLHSGADLSHNPNQPSILLKALSHHEGETILSPSDREKRTSSLRKIQASADRHTSQRREQSSFQPSTSFSYLKALKDSHSTAKAHTEQLPSKSSSNSGSPTSSHSGRVKPSSPFTRSYSNERVLPALSKKKPCSHSIESILGTSSVKSSSH